MNILLLISNIYFAIAAFGLIGSSWTGLSFFGFVALGIWALVDTVIAAVRLCKIIKNRKHE
jgi:hypothetical protein